MNSARSPEAGTAAATAPSLQILRDREGRLTLRLSGHLDATTIPRPWSEAIAAIRPVSGSEVALDTSEVTYCDGAGAAMLADLHRRLKERHGTLVVRGFPERFRPILDVSLRQAEIPVTPVPERPGFIENVGQQTVVFLRGLHELVSYTGEVVAALAWAASHPTALRWKDVFRVMQQAGVMAFPVVSLVLFLIGLILVYQTAPMFHQYGADIYLADMLGVALLRELGPLMVAIMITARSGSAFAAELGTMQVNEEVDALTTMGLEPVRFLVAPRVVAAVLITPILTAFGNLAGLVGGLLPWTLQLHLPLVAFKNQLRAAVDSGDFLSGLGKSFAFGILIAAIGCIRGIQTRGGPASVGESATKAVVSGIVLIVLADMIFGVIFYNLGI